MLNGNFMNNISSSKKIAILLSFTLIGLNIQCTEHQNESFDESSLELSAPQNEDDTDNSSGSVIPTLPGDTSTIVIVLAKEQEKEKEQKTPAQIVARIAIHTALYAAWVFATHPHVEEINNKTTKYFVGKMVDFIPAALMALSIKDDLTAALKGADNYCTKLSNKIAAFFDCSDVPVAVVTT